MLMTKSLKEIIAMIEHKYNKDNKALSQTAIGEMIGISQRSVSYLFDKNNTIESLRTDTIEKIADHFGLEPYHLMIPDLPIEELISLRIEKIINCYSQSPAAGRENIERIAQNEVRYNFEQLISNHGG